MSSEQGTFSSFWENGEGFSLDGVLGGLVDDDEEREELLDGDTPRQEKGSKPKKKEVYWEQDQGGAQLDKIKKNFCGSLVTRHIRVWFAFSTRRIGGGGG